MSLFSLVFSWRSNLAVVTQGRINFQFYPLFSDKYRLYNLGQSSPVSQLIMENPKICSELAEIYKCLIGTSCLKEIKDLPQSGL